MCYSVGRKEGFLLNERIKQLRKELGKTLEEFGKPLGLTRSAISNIENGHRQLSTQAIISICREYNVNEEWLRTGEGEMFIELDIDDEIAAYIGRTLKDEKAVYQRKLLLFFSRLSPELLSELEKAAEEILGE